MKVQGKAVKVQGKAVKVPPPAALAGGGTHGTQFAGDVVLWSVTGRLGAEDGGEVDRSLPELLDVHGCLVYVVVEGWP